MTNRRHFLAHGIVGLLTWFAASAPLLAARSPRIVAVRAWPAEEYTRVTLEADAALSYEPLFLTDPPRLVLDLKGVEVQAALRALSDRISRDDPYVAAVRVGQFTPEVARIVFDLKQPVTHRLFLLEPVANYQYRLVLDLYPQTPLDPVERLLTELRSKPTHAPEAPVVREPHLSETPPRQSQGTDLPPRHDKRPNPNASADKPPPKKAPKPSSPSPANPYLVVLDPGHGGEDPGAIGPRGTQEKEVVLAVARRVKRLLEADRRIRAVLTREGDYFVPLAERVHRARRIQADLFVSLHADAFIRADVAGSSVYVLNERGASTTAARLLAQKENQSDLIGGVQLASRSDTVAQTLLDLSLAATRHQAERLAETVLAALSTVSPPHRPQVESANFAVLRNPDVPSILVELAFITNPTEERRLRDPSYQEKLAEAISTGITRHLYRHVGKPRNRMLAAQTAASPL